MTNQIQNPNVKIETKDKKYDLEERTSKFGEDSIVFAQSLLINLIIDLKFGI
jgi:hypothetical protein